MWIIIILLPKFHPSGVSPLIYQIALIISSAETDFSSIARNEFPDKIKISYMLVKYDPTVNRTLIVIKPRMGVIILVKLKKCRL